MLYPSFKLCVITPRKLMYSADALQSTLDYSAFSCIRKAQRQNILG
jgi:hypothetical protein